MVDGEAVGGSAVLACAVAVSDGFAGVSPAVCVPEVFWHWNGEARLLAGCGDTCGSGEGGRSWLLRALGDQCFYWSGEYCSSAFGRFVVRCAAFWMLQVEQVTARLSAVWLPPRARGMMWSRWMSWLGTLRSQR